MPPEIISIVGKSNSGKTTLMVKLITELTQRGYKIGSVKHAHDGFEPDQEGKDSWRHKKAGAAASLVMANGKIALVKDDDRPDLERIQYYHRDVDLILAEGFKRHPLPKIEIFRVDGPHGSPLCLEDPNLIAFVTDGAHRPDHVPTFGLEDINAIASFIEETMLQMRGAFLT